MAAGLLVRQHPCASLTTIVVYIGSRGAEILDPAIPYCRIICVVNPLSWLEEHGRRV